MIKTLKSLGALAELIVRGVRYLLKLKEKKKVDNAIENKDNRDIDDGKPSNLNGVQRFPETEKDSF